MYRNRERTRPNLVWGNTKRTAEMRDDQQRWRYGFNRVAKWGKRSEGTWLKATAKKQHAETGWGSVAICVLRGFVEAAVGVGECEILLRIY